MGMRGKPAVLIVLVAAATSLGLSASAAPMSQPAVVGHYSTLDSYVPMSTDSRYLAAMRWLIPGSAFAQSSDSDLIGFAKNFCSNGADSSALSKEAEVRSMFGISSGELRAILRTMAANYCPDLLSGV